MDEYRPPYFTIMLRAVLALVASAFILIVLFALYTEYQVPAGANREHAKDMLRNTKQAAVGGAESQGELQATPMYQLGESQYHAIAVSRGQFQAENYPLLTYQVDTLFPGPRLKLIWRTASDPGMLHIADLQLTHGGISWLDLSRNPDWQGSVQEIGIYALASAAKPKLSISRFTLEPFGWRGIIASHWSDWTALRGWSGTSVNFLYGTADPKVLSPVPVAAAWAALALALLLVARIFGGGLQPGALAAVLLVPWISLDLLWQKELTTQLAMSRMQFAGKTVHEKHLVDSDSQIYRYIKRLKEDVLPKKNSRIIILHESKIHNFERLKAQYYLLPNNVYNLGYRPPAKGLDSVDYILVLGEIPGLELLAQGDSLIWLNRTHPLRVQLLDSDPMGKLYRVLQRQFLSVGVKMK